MSKRRTKRPAEKPDLGTGHFVCPHCGHQFDVDWAIIYDIQETTHGYVGIDISYEYIECPQCGENVNDSGAYGDGPKGGSGVAIPKYIKADVERALLHAYYRQVCKCESVGLDQGSSLDSPWTAVGLKGNQVWVMDFSSFYEFPEQMKQGTVNRRIQERAEVAAAEGSRRCSRFPKMLMIRRSRMQPG